MAHYPKGFLRAVWHEFMLQGRLPSEQALDDLSTYTARHLTSDAMVRYMLRDTPTHKGRILFLDESLPDLPDYLSMMTMIGLARTPGLSVDVVWPAPYLYSDWTGDPLALYGRGFGYAKRIQSDRRSLVWGSRGGSGAGLPDLDQYDAIIIGSVSRNRQLTTVVSAASTSSRRIYLHGEDRPPDRSARRWLRNLVGECFVREIY